MHAKDRELDAAPREIVLDCAIERAHFEHRRGRRGDGCSGSWRKSRHQERTDRVGRGLTGGWRQLGCAIMALSDEHHSQMFGRALDAHRHSVAAHRVAVRDDRDPRLFECALDVSACRARLGLWRG